MVARHWCSEPLRSLQLAAWIAMTVPSASAKVGTVLAERRGSWPRAISRGVLQRPLAGHAEGDDGVAPEAEAGRSAVDADALRPGLVEAAKGGGPDQKAEPEAAAAITVATRAS